jgi:hypothetical protein
MAAAIDPLGIFARLGKLLARCRLDELEELDEMDENHHEISESRAWLCSR